MSAMLAQANGALRVEALSRLVGDSPAIRSLLGAIEKLAATAAPVLITGETGTGKELVARLLHAQSGRSNGPFVAVNCAALPAGLFHAEVFGYEKGAFTGAYRRNPGRIEAAQGGTLFLDEIGDLALDMQVILLRFLETSTFERLGSVDPIHADVRIVTATHADLELKCRNGSFREDLFYRLNTLRLHTPPLRERAGDVELLAEHFLREFCREADVVRSGFEPAALQRMRGYAWPGNIRELRNRIRQAVVMCDGEVLSVRDLGLEQRATAGNGEGRAMPSLRECRQKAEREAIERALRASAGRVPQAAEQLRVSRAQLYRLIERHGLAAVLR